MLVKYSGLQEKKSRNPRRDPGPLLFRAPEFSENWQCRKPSFRESRLSETRDLPELQVS